MYEAAVIGGGAVGLSLARGLAAQGLVTCVLDEGDVALRASRGNFALIWVQSKGLGMPAYGAWTQRAAALWPDFAVALRNETGIDVAHRQPGGYCLCLTEGELEQRREALRRMNGQPGCATIPWEAHDHATVAQAMPAVGRDVVGGIYCPLDGDVNSLRLFRALHASIAERGVTYLAESPVRAITPLPAGGFRIGTPRGDIEAERVILAAGLGNAVLAPLVGLSAPVRAQRGQIMVTEKTTPFLPYPIHDIRQTDEGGVMLGASKEDDATDDRTTPGILAAQAWRAIRMFPLLAALNVVRCWAAMRILSPDGFPIYDVSTAMPGAFLVTCHSGITLAPVHAELLAPMIARGTLDQYLSPFKAARFDVPAAA
jgi:glycine/D-amino acid oxidase-like deaminating enzyme